MSLTPVQLEQLSGIKIQSPLALIGAFLYIVRHRFDPVFESKWIWRADPATSDLIIEAQFNDNTEVSDGRPGIYIDRDQTTYGKVSTGHLDQDQPRILERQLTHHYSVGQTDMIIDCLSASRGESMQLADTVQSYLESSRYIIMGVFGFRDLSPIIMSRTQAFERQTDLHQTTLSFRVEYETRWAVAPAYPVLRGLAVHLTETGQGVNTALTDIYLKSSK